MFEPPFCPNRRCTAHETPPPGFWAGHGTYEVKCRPRPVPRYRCRLCGKTFSRQTFRADYRDHKPHLNAELFWLLASGVGLRQAARVLKLSRECTAAKALKIGRHCRALHLNLLSELEGEVSLLMDEIETYEGRRNTRPLTMPFLIERESDFVFWSESAMIPPSGRMSKERKALIQAENERFGPRPNHSKKAVRRTLERVVPVVEGAERIFIDTDEKMTYPGLIKEAFGEERVVHFATNSTVARMTWNPLFRINHTEAMARDLMSRLRRESWLTSKKRRYLDVAVHVFMAFRNYVRRQVNDAPETPAQVIGFATRPLKVGEVLSWRQVFGRKSPRPAGAERMSVGEGLSAA